MQLISIASILAVAATARVSSATPVDYTTRSTADQNCDPVGCYSASYFSVLGDFNGNGNIGGKLYYQVNTIENSSLIGFLILYLLLGRRN
jgi:hypothetical protein